MQPLPLEYIILGVAAVLIVSIVGSKISEKIGVPSLLLFLLVGMVLGSEGPGGIYFNNPRLSQAIGIVALSFILFAGGLETEWSMIRPVLLPGIALSTVGVGLTATLVAVFCALVLNFSWLEAFLLGSIVSSTDAAAVFSVLRSRRSSLKGELRPLLELESGANDPMAVFLTTGFIALITQPDRSAAGFIPLFLLQFTIGLAMGVGLGKLLVRVVNRLKLDYEGLYPVFTLSAVLLTYGLTVSIKGNGFLAVYVLGLVLGNSGIIHKMTLMRFHDGMAWLMQIAMFLALGLLVFPSELLSIAGTGILVSLVLILVARPLSVFLSLGFFSFNIRERALLSWVGLRGAVPIVLATYPFLAGLDESHRLFSLVFFIVITSVLIQAPLLPYIAKALSLASPLPAKKRLPLQFEAPESSDLTLEEFVVPLESPIERRSIVDLGLPKEILIVLIVRDDSFMTPSGDTVLQQGDVLMVLSDKKSFSTFNRIISGKKAT